MAISQSKGAAPAAGFNRGREDARRSNHIEEIQRARLLAAVTEVACVEGVANVTVGSVVVRAGVSRRTFYEVFSSAQACVLAAIEDAKAHMSACALPVWEATVGDWQARIRTSLATLLACLDQQPQMARLLVVEWLGAGTVALERRRDALAALTAVVNEGHAARGAGVPHGGAELTPLTAEGVVGAVASVLHDRLLGPEPRGPLLDLLNPLMSMIVLPYLGPMAARDELRQSPPEIPLAAVRQPPPHGELGRLGIRITYRTVQVLSVIASSPDGSNRDVAEAAGVRDAGQISKLLGRLERVGLVHNKNPRGPRQGRPNAWSLTPCGERVERSLRA